MGELHAKRADSLAKNKFDSAGFLVDEKPKFGATLIDQSGLKKKVVWRWKELTNEYEYVYKVVGLSDMIERRSSNAEMSVAEMDVYCTLCTAIISYSQEAVDEHIRSLTHIINYAVSV
ncbi:unnamed protein product [Anisakis simplex]|uniref:Uncharacterized protein n=1 Tax=Anisakis simplex TaxID=6269 RepID=A0A3P6NTV7_ANISI|nr:unnamed protein product [Anisakis simplex]